jgi:hypothetical protein
MRVLTITDTGYRATVEEQDDTVLWFTAMCAKGGLHLAVLLRGAAVNYGVRGQDASGLRFGKVEVANPPQLDDDLADLIAQGTAVHYVAEDAEELGIAPDELVAGVRPVGRADVAGLIAEFDQVWHW